MHIEFLPEPVSEADDSLSVLLASALWLRENCTHEINVQWACGISLFHCYRFEKFLFFQAQEKLEPLVITKTNQVIDDLLEGRSIANTRRYGQNKGKEEMTTNVFDFPVLFTGAGVSPFC